MVAAAEMPDRTKLPDWGIAEVASLAAGKKHTRTGLVAHMAMDILEEGLAQRFAFRPDL